MCSLVQVKLCVYHLVAGDELTLSVLRDLTLQVNLFSRKIIYWLPQFTRNYNRMFLNSHKGRCGRLGVRMLDNSSLGNSVVTNSSWITIQFNSILDNFHVIRIRIYGILGMAQFSYVD